MRIVPSSSMSICTSWSASRPRIVSPPLPITMPIFSGSIFTVEMRGAFSFSSVRTSGIASSILSRMISSPLGLLERRLHDLPRNAGDLDVHLQAGDALAGTGDLEVHVTEMVLGALDVGEDDVIVALLDEAHRDAGHW